VLRRLELLGVVEDGRLTEAGFKLHRANPMRRSGKRRPQQVPNTGT
jgi:hypothetical protein